MESQEQLTKLNDAALAALVAAGNADAFVELAARYMFLVRAKASAFRGAGLDADDLCQEGQLGLFSAACSYDPAGKASFRTYAGVCILNRIIMAYRKASSGKHKPLNDFISLSGGDFEAPGGDAEDPERIVMGGEGLKSLQKRIKQLLSSLEQRVLSLYLSGCSYAEIARQLGITEKAADNALQRLRRKLRASV